MIPPSHIKIYQSDDGQTSFEVILQRDTLWQSQAQIVKLFEKDSDTICLYLKNIYQQGELDDISTIEDSSVVRDHYSLAGSR